MQVGLCFLLIFGSCRWKRTCSARRLQSGSSEELPATCHQIRCSLILGSHGILSQVYSRLCWPLSSTDCMQLPGKLLQRRWSGPNNWRMNSSTSNRHCVPSDHPYATGFVSASDRCLGSWDWNCIEREEGQHGKTCGFLFPQAASKGTTIFCYRSRGFGYCGRCRPLRSVSHWKTVYHRDRPQSTGVSQLMEGYNWSLGSLGSTSAALHLQSGASRRFQERQCRWTISASLGRSQYYNHTMMASGLSKKGGGGGGGCYARLPTFDYLFILLFVYVSDHAITTLFDHHAGFCMHNPNCLFIPLIFTLYGHILVAI